MEKITSILSKKQHHFHTTEPQSTASKALHQMCCENVDYLIVMDQQDRFLGLITEHDIASSVIAAKRQLNKTKVTDVMSKQLPSATTEDTVERCMQLMRQHNIRYLPIFENFHFRGIISSEDILEEAVSHRQEIFDEALPAPVFGPLI